MKKLVSCLLSATLSAAVLLSFAGCQWDAGGSNFTPSDEWIAAAAAYNAKVAEIETAVENEAEYTKTSREAMKTAFEALPTFKTAGHTAEEIYAQIEALNALCEEKLVTPDQAIDDRINAAIGKLNLHVSYGEVYNGNRYRPDSEHPEGSTVYFKTTEDGDVVTCEKDDEGAFVVANKGVTNIQYDKENNSAVFNLYPESADLLLMDFLNTNVMGIFNNDFNDLTEIQFDVDVIAEGETEVSAQKLVMSAEQANGMYLAAGLIAVCIGYDQELYDFSVGGNVDGFNQLLKEMKEKTFAIIAGTNCSASVTFSNGDYTKTVDFAVSFSNI